MAKKKSNSERKEFARKDENERLRKRAYATVVYPESAPDGWIDILQEAHVAAFVSPLHDRDISGDGEAKKPHYHVMVMFSSPKRYDTQVKPLFDKIGGVGYIAVSSTRSMARYLIHQDDPDKAQYSRYDVQAFGGADYLVVSHQPSDDIKYQRELLMFIEAENMYYYHELLHVLMHDGLVDLYNYAQGHSFFTVEVLKSRMAAAKHNRKDIADMLADREERLKAEAEAAAAADAATPVMADSAVTCDADGVVIENEA